MLKRLGWSAYMALQMLRQPRIPFMPFEKLKGIQSRRVRSTVAFASRTVPYYRDTFARLGLSIDDFRAAEDLAKLPIIEPGDLQRNAEYYVSRAKPLESYTLLRTGGSSGDPRPVYHDTAAILSNAAHGERERSIMIPLLGRRFGYRETVIISENCTCQKLQSFGKSAALMPRALVIKRQYVSLMDPPEKNVPLINEFKPDMIQTYGSYLAILFSYLAKTGAEFHRPKVLFYSSDGLPESIRRLIAEKFGIPVFSAYQANEALKIGFECERHSCIHLNMDLYPVRIVDEAGRDVPEGQTGEVVVSNLVNRGMVLLNYRLGDLAAFIPGGCGCGRTLPMLSFPPGRSDDLLELPSGDTVHPQIARTIFTTESQVWQYQIIQDSRLHFTVKAIAAKEADVPALRQRVLAKFAERFGRDVTVDLSFVDSIDRTVGGKFRPVMSMRKGMPLKRLGEGSPA